MSSNKLTTQGGSAHFISFCKRLTNTCDLHSINCGFLLASPKGVQIPFMIRFLSYFLYSQFYLPILHLPKILLLSIMCILHYVAFVLWLCCLFYLRWLNLIAPLRPSSASTSTTQVFSLPPLHKFHNYFIRTSLMSFAPLHS